MATLSVLTSAVTGTALTYASCAATGDVFPNDGKTLVHFLNTGTQKTVTFVSPATVGGLATTDPTATVLATTGTCIAGPFDPVLFNNASGQVAMTYSSETALSVAVIKLP